MAVTVLFINSDPPSSVIEEGLSTSTQDQDQANSTPSDVQEMPEVRVPVMASSGEELRPFKRQRLIRCAILNPGLFSNTYLLMRYV